MKNTLSLVIDVGNTSTSYGFYKQNRLFQSSRCLTDEFPIKLETLIEKQGNNPSFNVAISSVVPKLTQKIRKITKRHKVSRVWVVGQNLKIKIKHKYISINKLGADRLVNLYGGMRFYGKPILIFDFGTAVTCDYISAEGVFEGGLIIPGPGISFEALGQKTALLPRLKFPQDFKFFLGRDTVSGMKAGILQSYAAMTDGLIERFKKQYGRRLRVIATGGFANTIACHTHFIDVADPSLTLRGLGLALGDQKIS